MTREAIYPLAFALTAAAMFLINMPIQASDADDAIVSAFKSSYVNKMYLKDDTIKIEAKEGAVTLTGTVAYEAHKTLAQETAANLHGVSSVDNQLNTKAEVTAENADIWIGKKVQFALLFHRSVSYLKTDVRVNNGVVTLQGEASSMAQKELATEYAKDIDGVKEVKNEMTVAAAKDPAQRTVDEKLDDASITALAKTALLTHQSTSALKTKVQTRDGTVTLTGIAKNAAEKDLVTKLVTDIHGVTTVKNEMTVAEIVSK